VNLVPDVKVGVYEDLCVDEDTTDFHPSPSTRM
jgi:hypothetical protein